MDHEPVVSGNVIGIYQVPPPPPPPPPPSRPLPPPPPPPPVPPSLLYDRLMMPQPPGTFVDPSILPIAQMPSFTPVIPTPLFSIVRVQGPIELYIGKIPMYMDHNILMRVLEVFGRLAKWCRPSDRSFGLFTYNQEIAGLRCLTLLPTIEFGPRREKFMVKLGSKEKAALTAYSESDYAESDDILRERLEALAKQGASSGPLPQDGEGTESGLPREVQEQVDAFRAAQTIRDKELEAQRRSKILAKVQEINRLKKRSRTEMEENEVREGGDEDVEVPSAVVSGNDKKSDHVSTAQDEFKPVAGGVISMGVKAKVSKQAMRLFDAADEEDVKRAIKSITPLDYAVEDSRPALQPAIIAPLPNISIGNLPVVARVPMTEKEIADSIPTDKAALFAFPDFSWSHLKTHRLLENNIKTWVQKRMVEEFGSDELANSLTAFVMDKLQQETAPSVLVEELKGALDKTSETFVVRLWRMLIFTLLKVRSV